MNAFSMLLVEALLSIAVSLAVLFMLSPPLARVLRRICPDEESAAFWVSYAKIMLVIAPLLLVLAVDLLAHSSDPLSNLRLATMATLGGMLFALRSVGARLGKFVKTPQ